MQTVQTAGLRGLSALLLLLGAGFSAGSQAQGFPNKPIHIHAAGAGGTTDVIARLVGNEFSAAFGQPVVVENRAGSVLVAGVAKAAPDGYTLVTAGGTLWIAPLFEESQFDIRHFAPIVAATRSPNILVVNASLPVQSVADLIKLAKARPGELNYSTGGTGGATNVAFELLKSMANIRMVRIMYKDAQETTDLVSGQVHMTIGTASSSWAPQVKTGKLRALATGGAKRSVLFPDLPAIAETVPGYEADQLVGMLAPVNTPEAVIRRLNQEAARALAKPEIRDRLLKGGLEPLGGTSEQFATMIHSDIARMNKTIKDLGIKPAGS